MLARLYVPQTERPIHAGLPRLRILDAYLILGLSPVMVRVSESGGPRMVQVAQMLLRRQVRIQCVRGMDRLVCCRRVAPGVPKDHVRPPWVFLQHSSNGQVQWRLVHCTYRQELRHIVHLVLDDNPARPAPALAHHNTPSSARQLRSILTVQSCVVQPPPGSKKTWRPKLGAEGRKLRNRQGARR